MAEVRTWDEFLTAIEGNEAVSVMNDIECGKLTADKSIKCGRIEGNGYSLTNLITTGDYGFTQSYNAVINDLNIVNLNHQSSWCLFGGANGYTTTFNRCRINGLVIGSALTRYNTIFNNCSFAVRGYNKSLFASNSTSEMNNCDIMLYGEWTNLNLNKFKSSRLSGGVVNSFGSTTANKSAFDVAVNGNISLTATGSIINTDKATGSISGGLIGVTSEQMIDIEYLNSIGFEVFPDVDNS